MAAGRHPGWEQTAWDGIEQTVDLLEQKRIKVIVNGGAQNPKGLAHKVHELVRLGFASRTRGKLNVLRSKIEATPCR